MWPFSDHASRDRAAGIDAWFTGRGGSLQAPTWRGASAFTDVAHAFDVDEKDMARLVHREAVWRQLAVAHLRLAPVALLGTPDARSYLKNHTTLGALLLPGEMHPDRQLSGTVQRTQAFDVVLLQFWPKLPPLFVVLRPTPKAYAVSFDTAWWVGGVPPPRWRMDHRISSSVPSGLDNTNQWSDYTADMITPAVQRQLAHDRGPVQAIFIANGWIGAHCGNQLDAAGVEVALGLLESVALAIDEAAVARHQEHHGDAMDFLHDELDEGI